MKCLNNIQLVDKGLVLLLKPLNTFFYVFSSLYVTRQTMTDF